jgi:DNA-directed RNA polymerase specialized sigma24 family protein
MDRAELDNRLSRMSTMWTMVFQAHAAEADASTAALAQLVERYSGVVFRYLLGAVRDPDIAAELSQEFALRVLQGAFKRADPGRGRFRDYLKTSLVHLVDDHHRSQRSQPRPLPLDEPASPGPLNVDSNSNFAASWRDELLERTWKALAAAQPVYHAVLLFRVDNPEAPSSQMAQELGARLGSPMRPDQVRKALQRAHAKFAELLVDEVEASLGDPSREEVAEELRELDLLKYCRTVVERRA